MENTTSIVACVVTCMAAATGALAEASGDASLVEAIPSLVGFWTFGEQPGQPRLSQGTPSDHPLLEVAKAGTSPTISRIEEGPFSGYGAHFDGSHYFGIDYDDTGDLNINGLTAEVTMIAYIRLDAMSKTVAGMWYEGGGAYDDVGSRQYALLMDMPTYGGNDQVTPHISAEGGVSRRADGSAMPWCCDYASSVSTVATGEWVSVGFTYDSQYIKAFYNGVFEAREMNPAADNRTDSYFTEEGPGGGYRGMNAYYHGKGIFEYDPDVHGETKPQGGADFTVGSRYSGGGWFNEPMRGAIGGLAVFDRALSDAEMLAAHDAANLDELNDPSPLPDELLKVDFENTVGGNNVSLVDYNANTGENWQALFGPDGTVSGQSDSGSGVRVANSTVAGVGFYLAALTDGSDTVAFAWTDDAPATDADLIESIAARLNNKSASDLVRFAVRIDGQWFASDQAFAIDPPGVGYNDWTNSQVVELAFTTDAASWRLLDMQPGSSLALGAASPADLAGSIDAFGVFVDLDGAGLLRLDDFTVTVPEPGTLALLALGGGLLLRRRRDGPSYRRAR